MEPTAGAAPSCESLNRSPNSGSEDEPTCGSAMCRATRPCAVTRKARAASLRSQRIAGIFHDEPHSRVRNHSKNLPNSPPETHRCERASSRPTHATACACCACVALKAHRGPFGSSRHTRPLSVAASASSPVRWRCAPAQTLSEPALVVACRFCARASVDVLERRGRAAASASSSPASPKARRARRRAAGRARALR